MTATIRDITIDPEFESLIPPLGEDERAQLMVNIDRDGFRDPLVVWKTGGLLLDGHNRYRIWEVSLEGNKDREPQIVEIELADRDDAKIWIIKNQFGRRNLAAFTRGELALKLEPLLKLKAKQNSGTRTDLSAKLPTGSKQDTRKSLAKSAGVGERTIDACKTIVDHADEDTKHKLRTNQVSVHRVAKDIKEKLDRDARQTKREAAAKTTKTTKTDSRIIVGDFRLHADKVADGSVSLIFTDPPYDRKSLSLFDGLGRFAAEKLADGGSLLCYVGHIQLREALNALSEHLRYWWPICCLHSGRKAVMREYGINACWKPILWFVKGTRDEKQVMVDDVVSGAREKDQHDWQQAQGEAEYWIEKLSPKNGLVCDPFLGGGTTAAAATRLGREWIGFEIDPKAAESANARVA